MARLSAVPHFPHAVPHPAVTAVVVVLVRLLRSVTANVALQVMLVVSPEVLMSPPGPTVTFGALPEKLLGSTPGHCSVQVYLSMCWAAGSFEQLKQLVAQHQRGTQRPPLAKPDSDHNLRAWTIGTVGGCSRQWDSNSGTERHTCDIRPRRGSCRNRWRPAEIVSSECICLCPINVRCTFWKNAQKLT